LEKSVFDHLYLDEKSSDENPCHDLRKSQTEGRGHEESEKPYLAFAV